MMTKNEFLSALRKSLEGLPKEDIERSLAFYGEMIDDRTEDGMSEEEATASIGLPNDIAAQILSEIPLPKLVKAKMKPKRRLRAWEIVLLILGSPVWIPLLAAAFVVLLAIYIVIWSVVIVFFAVNITFAACSVAALALIAATAATANIPAAIAFLGASLILAGLTILAFFGCKESVRGMLKLSKLIIKTIKSCFIGKEAAK